MNIEQATRIGELALRGSSTEVLILVLIEGTFNRERDALLERGLKTAGELIEAGPVLSRTTHLWPLDRKARSQTFRTLREQAARQGAKAVVFLHREPGPLAVREYEDFQEADRVLEFSLGPVVRALKCRSEVPFAEAL